MGKRIAVIGGGISGIAASNVLQRNGHTVTIFEKSDRIGGVWAVSYPEVRLQNTWHQYALSDFPWPFRPDLHPTAAQILRYMQDAIAAFELDLRVSHEVAAMHETADGWELDIRQVGGLDHQLFDYVVIAVGQYTEGKYFPDFPERSRFQGQVITERDVKDLSIFKGHRALVVGFGKSALDMAVLAVDQGANVQHVFRTPRWTLPPRILGLHYTYLMFARFGSVMMTSWAHPTGVERFLHKQLKFVVERFWRMLQAVFRLQIVAEGYGKGPEVRQRLETVIPTHPLQLDFRSATALAPAAYYRYVAEGRITPHHREVLGFDERGLRLSADQSLAGDIVVLSLGSKTPTFPFVPPPYCELLEAEADGVQLYRHLLHPRIPNLGFAGFNHGFMHIPSVELGAIWLCACLDGYLQLPPVEAMEASIEQVRRWKREHIHFEPSRGLAINTRYQQYNDILLKDLGLNPYRKGANFLAEFFARYGGKDYRNVLSEYQKQASRQPRFEPLPLDT
jgi:hypothetical protein